MRPLALHLYAECFLNAACSLPSPNVPFEPVRPYLVCHAIELGLKAFLSLQGFTMLNLSENIYGHDLNKILQKADENKIKAYIALTDDHCVYIRLASNYYSGKVFEYPTVFEAMQCYPDMPPIDELFSAATILVESLRQSCLEAK